MEWNIHSAERTQVFKIRFAIVLEHIFSPLLFVAENPCTIKEKASIQIHTSNNKVSVNTFKGAQIEFHNHLEIFK